ncbi:HNH endonuclease [Marinobacter sp. UBA2678]|uniref:HNH endonuclease n=1 Tax=Marinobacter sp. UBA2678 TaxID=1946815 RepID=UPI000C0A9CCD|nr:HNH endonuclease signature motif containing protein [Marinobacter sp. UBA2678]MAM85719.1 HNH endonuclease [Hahellaceae bacterium]
MPQRTAKPCRDKLCRMTTREKHGYCEAHADQAKSWTRGRASRGRGGRPWRRLRDQVLERDRYLCQCEECRSLSRIRPAQEVDHIVPLTEGGTDAATNLRAINRDCHKEKTAREANKAGRAVVGH